MPSRHAYEHLTRMLEKVDYVMSDAKTARLDVLAFTELVRITFGNTVCIPCAHNNDSGGWIDLAM